MKNVLKLILVVVIVSSTSLLSARVIAVAPTLTLDLLRQKKIENKDIPTILRLVAKKENIDYKKLTALAYCESSLRHYKDNGKVLTGIVNPNDKGVLQINEPTWKKTAKELNLNIYDPIENCLLAAWIIKHDSRGWKNWVCYK